MVTFFCRRVKICPVMHQSTFYPNNNKHHWMNAVIFSVVSKKVVYLHTFTLANAWIMLSCTCPTCVCVTRDVALETLSMLNI